MIRVSVRTGLLGDEVEHFELPRAMTLTPRVLLKQVAEQLPKSVPVGVAVDGSLVEGDELDIVLRDGQNVMLVPTTGYGAGETIVAVLIQVAISAVISYVAYVLSPRPKPPGVAQDRGDESSSTYAWDGIKTNYGPGLPIPWGYGRHPIGGQVIWADIEASRSGSLGFVDDRFRLILSLVDGQIHRIGDVPAASVDRLGEVSGTFPDHVRVNGNLLPKSTSSATAWLRPGTQDQPPMPAPFVGVSQTFSPQGELNDVDESATFTFSEAREIAMLGFVFSFPAGLYQQLQSGSLVGAQVLVYVEARLLETGQVIQLPFTVLGDMNGSPHVGYYVETYRIELGVGFNPAIFQGPVEITVRRGTPSFGVDYVNSCLWRDLVVMTPHTLRYPQEALLGLELRAGERFSGGRPNVTVRCDLSLVRVWDSVIGWSPRCWDVPAAPFDFHTYAPGRNPAWCLLDFLLARWGLGRWLTEKNIDLPAFRRWAINCDQDPNPADPWGEPQYTVDLVGDRPRPAWDWVLAFCAAGRATPVMRNGKISVVYQYRDAHTDGVVTVPAKTPTQLITSGNCEDVKVTWLPKKNRPTVYQFQYLNEEEDYSQDVLPVEDDAGNLNDPTAFQTDEYRPEDVQAYGVTRPSQLFREGVWRHRIQAYARRQLEFRAGPWVIASEVGDVFEFEHELLRPFGDDVAVAMQVVGGGLSVNQCVVDHHLDGSGLQMVWRDPDGIPQRANIVSFVNGTGTNGRPISVVEIVGVGDLVIGTACVIGKVDKIVERYEMIATIAEKDHRHFVRAIQWTPQAYDPIAPSEFGASADAEALDAGLFDTDGGDHLPPRVFGIRLVAEPDGEYRLAWGRPPSHSKLEARIYVRPRGIDLWVFAGSTDLDELRLRGLRVGESYEVSVCLPNRLGQPVPAELGDHATVAPEEFPPYQLPSLTNVRATVLEHGVLVQWDELQQRDLDYFEVRSGSSWAAADILARERAPRVVLTNPPAGAPLLVAARSRSGLYGAITSVPNPGWTPAGHVSALSTADLAPAGTLTDAIWNAATASIELGAGKLQGSYESLEQDLGYQAPFFWRVLIDRREIEELTLGDLDFEMGSGEARWRTLEGRPASPFKPGVDWQLRLGDLDMPLGDLPDTLLLGGHIGEVGSHTRVLVESRFYVNGVWTNYRQHVDRVVVASRMQVRLALGRRTTGYTVRATALTYEAYL